MWGRFLVIQSNNKLGAVDKGFCRCGWKLIKCLIRDKTILCGSDLATVLDTFPVAMMKYAFRRQRFVLVRSPGYSLSRWESEDSRRLKQLLALSQEKRAVNIGSCSLPSLHLSCPRSQSGNGATHSEWAGLPTSINMIRIIPLLNAGVPLPGESPFCKVDS